jgi:hypothetical protein
MCNESNNTTPGPLQPPSGQPLRPVTVVMSPHGTSPALAPLRHLEPPSKQHRTHSLAIVDSPCLSPHAQTLGSLSPPFGTIQAALHILLTAAVERHEMGGG